MTNLQKQIELLEAQINEAELIAALACQEETRRRYQLLAKHFRTEAQAVGRQVTTIAAW